MLHHAHAPNSSSANPSELSAESPLSQPAAARHLSSTSTSSSTSAATANPNSLLNSAANTDNSHGGVVRRAPASLVTAAVPHPLILSDFCHGSHVSHRRAASDRAVLSASDADSIWTHNPAVPPTDQWTSELTSLQQTTELNRSSQEKVAARIRRSGSLMDMKAYPKQFQQQHEFLQPVKHGKYDSGSSTGSGNDLIDEAGTLFNFDEDNELLEEPITNLTVDYLPDRSEKRTLSFDGSVETGSDAYTWVGSLNEQQQIYSATRNSLESKWKSPNYALGGGSSSLRSPQSNFGEPHNESQDYAVSRQLVSPSISGLNGHMNGSHINSRRSVIASPGLTTFHRASVDVGRFGSIGMNGRSSNGQVSELAFKLPPTLESQQHLIPDSSQDKSPMTSFSPRTPFKDSTASPLFLPNSDSAKNIWGAPDMNIGVSIFKPEHSKENPKLSSQYDSRMVPSELLRRNSSTDSNSMSNQQQQYVRVKSSAPQYDIPASNHTLPNGTISASTQAFSKIKLNPNVTPFEFQPQQASIESYSTNNVHRSPSFATHSVEHYRGDNTQTYNPSFHFLPPSMSTAYRSPPDFQASPNRSSSALATHSIPDSPALYGGSTSIDFGSFGVATDLRIVKEIQTSKLRVDESKLTTEYFDQLTREANGLCIHICPTREELMRQGIAFGNVLEVARRAFPDANLHHFGSTALGFSLANADMDLSISLSENYLKLTSPQLVEKLGAVMKNAGMRDVKMLTRARVPIVKIRDPITGIRCDIGFQSSLVMYNTRLLKAYSQIDPRFRELVFIVKYWSKQRNINEPYFGTLSSYCFVLMIIHFLQVRGVLPCLQKIAPNGVVADDMNSLPMKRVEDFNVYFYEDVHELIRNGHWNSTNTESVGELLVAFFKYYSAEFPYVHGVASVRTGGVLSKEDKGWTKDRQQEINRSGAVKDRYWLCVEDPFEMSNNVGRPVDKETLFEVRGEFIRASKILCAGASEDNTLAKVCEKAPIVISKKGTGGMAMTRKW